jgi:hypothetical protein
MARASLGLYTTHNDLQALIVAVKDLVSRKDEILDCYEPIGSNGYQHREFKPAAKDIFDPRSVIHEFEVS